MTTFICTTTQHGQMYMTNKLITVHKICFNIKLNIGPNSTKFQVKNKKKEKNHKIPFSLQNINLSNF